MGKKAAILPGQGSQLVGMGRDVAEKHAVALDVFEQADKILGFSLSEACFKGPAEALEATDIQQPAIFTASVAVWRALESIAPAHCRYDAMAGLSLGEYTALHLAGAISFEDGLRLVRRRGQLMQEAAAAIPGGMVSIIGPDDAQVRAMCEQASSAGPIRPANYNCPGQIVVSGAKAACDKIVELVEQQGGRAVPLKVAGAFHSPLMQSAADGLRAALEAVAIQPPKVPVIANVNVKPHGDPTSIRDALVQQLVQPVQWHASIDSLVKDGFDQFVEIGPGRVLTGLMRRINRSVTAVSINDAAALEKIKETPSI